YYTLLKNQFLTLDELSMINWNKRKKILHYAFEKVPYYQKKFKEADLTPSDITDPEDYRKIPLLTKDDLRNSFDDILALEVEKKHLRLSSTGGSTGTPVKVFHDKRFPTETLIWRMLSWWNLTPNVDSAYVWRMTRNTRLSRILYSLVWWPTRRILFDASSMTSSDIGRFIQSFNQIKPDLLEGYVGAISHLASFIEKNNIVIHSPKAIWVTSSPLPRIKRQFIENTFNAPVYDQYGCSEVLYIAAECRMRKYLHIFTDTNYIEIVDEIGNPIPNEEMGRIVITDLENYAFPLIRYVTGDRGRKISDVCSCGNNLPLMDSVKGRETDLVILPDNSFLTGEYLTTIFDDFPDAVNAFQIRQKKDFSIVISVVPNPHNKNINTVLNHIKNVLTRKTRSLIPINIKIVDQITHDRGKNYYIISEIK
ncbi:MAG: phenylacetate--CoA ligase family protein, partial [Candidatus Hodarchaeota archaeon]